MRPDLTKKDKQLRKRRGQNFVSVVTRPFFKATWSSGMKKVKTSLDSNFWFPSFFKQSPNCHRKGGQRQQQHQQQQHQHHQQWQQQLRQQQQHQQQQQQQRWQHLQRVIASLFLLSLCNHSLFLFFFIQLGLFVPLPLSHSLSVRGTSRLSLSFFLPRLSCAN